MAEYFFEIIVVAVLILLNGLFALAEMAVVSSRLTKLEIMARDGYRGAQKALALLKEPSDFLATVQIGITLVGILAGAFGGATLSEEVAVAVSDQWPALSRYSSAIGLVVVVLPITYFSLIFGELVPKRLALSNPERLASRISGLMVALTSLAKPLVHFLSLSTDAIYRVLKIKDTPEPSVTEEEVKLLIEKGAHSGVFEKMEEAMLKRVFQLTDLRAGDLMTPRTKVVSLNLNEAPERILKRIAQNRHTYFPAYRGQPDHPVGLLSSKLVLAQMVRGEKIDLQKAVVETLFISETATTAKILESFKSSGKHIAIVVDEFGGMAGVLTLIDFMEGIVGNVPEAENGETPSWRKTGESSWIMDGLIALRELPDILKSPGFVSEEDEEGIQSLGGLVMQEIGRIPKEGDQFILHGFRFEVLDMDGHRVDKVAITAVPPLKD